MPWWASFFSAPGAAPPPKQPLARGRRRAYHYHTPLSDVGLCSLRAPLAGSPGGKGAPWWSLAPPLPAACTGSLCARVRRRAGQWGPRFFPPLPPPALGCSPSHLLSIYFHCGRARGQSRPPSATLRAGGGGPCRAYSHRASAVRRSALPPHATTASATLLSPLPYILFFFSSGWCWVNRPGRFSDTHARARARSGGSLGKKRAPTREKKRTGRRSGPGRLAAASARTALWTVVCPPLQTAHRAANGVWPRRAAAAKRRPAAVDRVAGGPAGRWPATSFFPPHPSSPARPTRDAADWHERRDGVGPGGYDMDTVAAGAALSPFQCL